MKYPIIASIIALISGGSAAAYSIYESKGFATVEQSNGPRLGYS